MTDLRTGSTQHSEGANGAAPPAPAPDPLARLHKMSTTAGITSQDYVAINIPSIVATLLGLASVLALVERTLLLIPLAAIGFGVVALFQIRDSNGTQTGRLFAWAGIVLAVLLGGSRLVRQLVEARAVDADQREIASLIATLGRHVKAGDYPAAHALFTDRFRQRVPLATFQRQWTAFQAGVAPVTDVQWNGVRMIFEPSGSGGRIVSAMGVFQLQGQSPARWGVIVHEVNGNWSIDDLPALFPPERKRRGDPGQPPQPDPAAAPADGPPAPTPG